MVNRSAYGFSFGITWK